jgi:hypothetical protein
MFRIANGTSHSTHVKPADPLAHCLLSARDAVERSARLLESVHAGTRSSRLQLAVSRHRVGASQRAIDSAPRADADCSLETPKAVTRG